MDLGKLAEKAKGLLGRDTLDLAFNSHLASKALPMEEKRCRWVLA